MTITGGSDRCQQRMRQYAVVVFVGKTTLSWLRMFRRGYRHCFVASQTEGGWIVHDPLSHYTHIQLISPVSAGALIAHYRRQGCTAVLSEVVVPPQRVAPVRPYTCVEAVKRILGVQDGWLLTPRQLYRHLRRTPTL